jgi:glycosyltransferase involved in cell wall biosynthesis
VDTIKVAQMLAHVSEEAGGVYTAARQLSSFLRTQRCDSSLVGLGSINGDRQLAASGIPVLATKGMGPRSFGYSPTLYSTLLGLECDILHSHGLWMYSSIAAHRWASDRKPLVISPHGMLDSWALAQSPIKKKIAWLLYEHRNLNSARVVHALNVAELASIRVAGIDGSVAVVPNGVEVPLLSEHNLEVHWRRNLPEGAKILLFLGRLHSKKGLLELLDAWARVKGSARPAVEPWRLVIAGWGEREFVSRFQGALAKNSHRDSIHFVGPQFGEEKQRTFANADAFVLPSKSEGLPVAVLEAWANSLPALITSACNLPDGFETGAAMKIDSSSNGIAAGLEALFTLPDDGLRAIGDRGRSLVMERYSWPRIAEQMLEVYRSILGQCSRPSFVDR